MSLGWATSAVACSLGVGRTSCTCMRSGCTCAQLARGFSKSRKSGWNLPRGPMVLRRVSGSPPSWRSADAGLGCSGSQARPGPARGRGTAVARHLGILPQRRASERRHLLGEDHLALRGLRLPGGWQYGSNQEPPERARGRGAGEDCLRFFFLWKRNALRLLEVCKI